MLPSLMPSNVAILSPSSSPSSRNCRVYTTDSATNALLKTPVSDKQDCNHWMEWAANHRHGSRRTTKNRSIWIMRKEPKPRKQSTDLLSDHDVDSRLEEHMSLPGSPRRRRGLQDSDLRSIHRCPWPTRNGSQSCSEDDHAGSTWGYAGNDTKRSRFYGEYLQADVIESMRAYLEHGCREDVPKKEPSSSSHEQLQQQVACLSVTSSLILQETIVHQLERAHQKQPVQAPAREEDSSCPSRHASPRKSSKDDASSVPSPTRTSGIIKKDEKSNGRDEDMRFRVNGSCVKVTPPGKVQDAVARGETTFTLMCVTCEGTLLVTAKAVMVYCPICGTLAPIDALIKIQ
jgi:hypothetical protein